MTIVSWLFMSVIIEYGVIVRLWGWTLGDSFDDD